eukprot:jgi/Tetstr1/427055/TSEL_017260.t1
MSSTSRHSVLRAVAMSAFLALHLNVSAVATKTVRKTWRGVTIEIPAVFENEERDVGGRPGGSGDAEVSAENSGSSGGGGGSDSGESSSGVSTVIAVVPVLLVDESGSSRKLLQTGGQVVYIDGYLDAVALKNSWPRDLITAIGLVADGASLDMHVAFARVYSDDSGYRPGLGTAAVTAQSVSVAGYQATATGEPLAVRVIDLSFDDLADTLARPAAEQVVLPATRAPGPAPESLSGTWRNPTVSGRPDHESAERGCVKEDGTSGGCETLGSDGTFIITDGDGAEVDAARLLSISASGDMVVFKTKQPFYVVDPRYPASNQALDFSGNTWVRLGVGPRGFIPTALRPASRVTCLASQLSTFDQDAAKQAAPKDNVFTAGDFDYYGDQDYESFPGDNYFKLGSTLTVERNGNVWLDADMEGVADTTYYVWEWTCSWPAPGARTAATVGLEFANPAAESFQDNESDVKSCASVDRTGNPCKVLGTDFAIAKGDSKRPNATLTASLVRMGDFVGFYSDQPVYLVDPGYPASNAGVPAVEQTSGASWIRLSMLAEGDLIDSSLAPATPVTCTGSQLSTFAQGRGAARTANLYTADDEGTPRAAVLRIYPSGQVWVDSEVYWAGSYNHVWEWSCTWPAPGASDSRLVDLDWGNPSASASLGHEGAEKSCFGPGGQDLCEMKYSADFTILQGDAGSSMAGMGYVVKSGLRAGFFSTKPVYVTGVDFVSTINDGTSALWEAGTRGFGATTLQMGRGIIPSGYRPATRTTCLASQLTTIRQSRRRDGALQAPPKANRFTTDHSFADNIAVITIMESGDVWVDADLLQEGALYSWEWSCMWSLE